MTYSFNITLIDCPFAWYPYDNMNSSHGLHLANVPMCMQNFITIFHSIQEIGPFSLFSNWSSAKPDRWKTTFHNLLGKILIISMFTQKSIKIFPSVQEIRPFSLFQNLNLGKTSANPKWHLTISWATSYQYQCVCKVLSKYSKRFKSFCSRQSLDRW